MRATVRPPPDKPRPAIAAAALAPLAPPRRPPELCSTLQPGVTYVPTHERPITWDLCPEPRHPGGLCSVPAQDQVLIQAGAIWEKHVPGGVPTDGRVAMGSPVVGSSRPHRRAFALSPFRPCARTRSRRRRQSPTDANLPRRRGVPRGVRVPAAGREQVSARPAASRRGWGVTQAVWRRLAVSPRRRPSAADAALPYVSPLALRSRARHSPALKVAGSCSSMNRSSTAMKCPGASSCGRWPTPGKTSRRLPGIAS